MYYRFTLIGMAIVALLGFIPFAVGSMRTDAQEATPPQGTPAGTPVTELTVEMIDIAFDPDEFTIPANTDVTVHLPNRGVIPHDFNIDALDIRSGLVQPGEETTVTINAPSGDYEYYCSVPGHREAGMVGTMHVT
jgi:nitrite reductase (NO-forming)